MPYAAPNKYVQASFFAKKHYRSPHPLKSTPPTANTSDCPGKFAMIICFCFNFLRILHSSAPKTIIWDPNPTRWPRQTESLTNVRHDAMGTSQSECCGVKLRWRKKIDLELSEWENLSKELEFGSKCLIRIWFKYVQILLFFGWVGF